MVGNDISSAPDFRAAYSSSQATSASLMPGRIVSKIRSKRLLPSRTARRISSISAASFTIRACSMIGGASRSRSFDANPDAGLAQLRTIPEHPLGRGKNRGFSADHDFRALHLGFGLCRVTSITEENGFALGDHEDG